MEKLEVSLIFIPYRAVRFAFSGFRTIEDRLLKATADVDQSIEQWYESFCDTPRPRLGLRCKLWIAHLLLKRIYSVPVAKREVVRPRSFSQNTFDVVKEQGKSGFSEDKLRDALASHATDIRSDADFESYARCCGAALLVEIELHFKKNPLLVQGVSIAILKDFNVLLLDKMGLNKAAKTLRGLDSERRYQEHVNGVVSENVRPGHSFKKALEQCKANKQSHS